MTVEVDVRDTVSTDFEWDDEVEDEEIVNMNRLLREGHHFKGHDFSVGDASSLHNHTQNDGESTIGGDRVRLSTMDRECKDVPGKVIGDRRVTRSSQQQLRKTENSQHSGHNIRDAVEELKKWVLVQFLCFKE